MLQDNARLSAENANLTEKLASSERANGRLIQELDGVSLVTYFSSSFLTDWTLFSVNKHTHLFVIKLPCPF